MGEQLSIRYNDTICLLHVSLSSKSNTFNLGILYFNTDGSRVLGRPEEITRRVTFFSLSTYPCNLQHQLGGF